MTRDLPRLPLSPENGRGGRDARLDRSAHGRWTVSVVAFLLILVVGVWLAATAVNPAIRAAELQDEAALRVYEQELREIVQRQQPGLGSLAKAAAADLASSRSCAQIVWVLAKDTIGNHAEAEVLLGQRSGDALAKVMSPVLAEIHAARLRLLSGAQARSEALLDVVGTERGPLRAMGPSDQASLTNAARPLLRSAAIAGMDMGVEAPAVRRLAGAVTSGLASTAKKLFAKQVARLAMAPIVAAADGPLPLGDILAILSAVFTAVELTWAQKDFENQVTELYASFLPQAMSDLEADSLQAGKEALKAHQMLRRQSFNRVPA